ncbi:MAG: ammonium transporter [Phycisphaerales bacterium]|nr:ammonium transporter [Phycisphaerales bacterium]
MFFSRRFRNVLPLLLLFILAVVALIIRFDSVSVTPLNSNFDLADSVFIFLCTILVFFMTPGLAFFYGGMVHRKNIISTIIKSFLSVGIVSILWIVIGFELVFGTSWHGIIGLPTHLFLHGMNINSTFSASPKIPLYLFLMYQMMFAIIAPALVVGAVAERVKFSSYLIFIILFHILIYCPIAHWMWNEHGFLNTMGALDYAGGAVVHISAGCASLAAAIVLAPRLTKFRANVIPDSNIPFFLLGTSILWFGWFGFNCGATGAMNSSALLAFITTNLSAATGGLSWMFVDKIREEKPSVTGFCIGAVVGLVAITPAAGFVSISDSIFIGFIASLISYFAVFIKHKLKFDDALDVFPCHGVAGIVGMFLTGVLGISGISVAFNHGGRLHFIFVELIAIVIIATYSFLIAYIVFKVMKILSPIRVSIEDEKKGLDSTQYEFL